MVTRYGMTDEFDMAAMETVNNQYLGGDTSLTCSPETARMIDEQVVKIVRTQHEKALNILKENEDKLKSLAQLPDSCEASADCLQQQRAIFEQYNVFSPAMIDGIIRRLRGYEDKTLRADLEGKPMEMLDLVHKYFHCG